MTLQRQEVEAERTMADEQPPAKKRQARQGSPGPDEDAEGRPEQEGADAEIGGPPGPEPTRYGDWERKGRCIDF